MNSSNVVYTKPSSNCWFMFHLSVWLDKRRATYPITRVFPPVSSVLARSQQGVFFQDPLQHDVARGGPRDGFMSVSWKKTPCCGRAPRQVAYRICKFNCWNSQQHDTLKPERFYGLSDSSSSSSRPSSLSRSLMAMVPGMMGSVTDCCWESWLSGGDSAALLPA